MRGRMARNAFAIGSAGVVVLGIVGCQQSKPGEEGHVADRPEDRRAGADRRQRCGDEAARRHHGGRSGRRRQGHLPAGVDRDGGRAQRPQCRAGYQHQERRADGHRQAQRRQPRLPGPAEAVRHRGRPAEGDRHRPADRRRSVHHRPGGPGVLRRNQGHRRCVLPGRPGRDDRVRHERHTQPERVEDLPPRPGQRRKAGPGSR